MAQSKTKKPQLPVRFAGPEEISIYEKLRRESFDKRISMNEIVIEQLRKRYQ